MPNVAILIAASPTRAFYSQLAALSLAVGRLPWSRWTPSIHAYFGDAPDMAEYGRWRPFLQEIDITWTSDARFARDGDWAQSDDAFRFAPRDVDVLLAMDADTLPIASLEPVLDRVIETHEVAGALAHYPTVLDHTFDVESSTFSLRRPTASSSVREAWERLSRDLIEVPLDYQHQHSLTGPDFPIESRVAPFYLNFGVVFFSATCFDGVASRYLRLRPAVASRMAEPAYSGQVALTLAIAASGSPTWALPMRYNFPNDPIAERMYPEELANVAVFHYLRTNSFDRHRIFTTAEEYRRFLGLSLSGVDRRFQEAVRSVVGNTYPFD